MKRHSAKRERIMVDSSAAVCIGFDDSLYVDPAILSHGRVSCLTAITVDALLALTGIPNFLLLPLLFRVAAREMGGQFCFDTVES